jgi:hypothetical protein
VMMDDQPPGRRLVNLRRVFLNHREIAMSTLNDSLPGPSAPMMMDPMLLDEVDRFTTIDSLHAAAKEFLRWTAEHAPSFGARLSAEGTMLEDLPQYAPQRSSPGRRSRADMASSLSTTGLRFSPALGTSSSSPVAVPLGDDVGESSSSSSSDYDNDLAPSDDEANYL